MMYIHTEISLHLRCCYHFIIPTLSLHQDSSKVPADCEDIASLLLTPEKAKEREELIAQGFPTWTRNHFCGFVDGMAVYGRERLDLVAPLVRY